MPEGIVGEASFRVLAVQGGYSRTTAVLANGLGEVLGVGFGEPSHSDENAEAHERMKNALEAALHGARERAGDADLSMVMGARLAMAGDSSLAAQIVGKIVPYARVISEDDAPAALVSVTFGEPGVVVLAGVGSVAFGRCSQGREVKVGGWGTTMGDEGGAYWIACQALSAITKAADGRAEETRLTSLLIRHWNAPNLTELHRMILDRKIDRPGIASAAERVGLAAQSGDAVAKRILRHAGHELGHLAATAVRRLSMQDSIPTVGVTGGVFQAGEPLLEPFIQVLWQSVPGAQVTPPRVPPVLGALALALMDLEIPLTPEIIGNLERAAPGVRAEGN
jgi:N-acetylglucosamine kinase-like BadF-type ATPase